MRINKLEKIMFVILLLLCCVSSPAKAFYQGFFAENSGTRKFRNVLVESLSSSSTNPGYRVFTHGFVLGTPKFIKQAIEETNTEAEIEKEKMIRKKKKEAKIQKMLTKHPERYTDVKRPDWDNHEDVTMFVVDHFGGSKKLIDFNVVKSGQVVCESKKPIEEISITEDDKSYIKRVYGVFFPVKADSIYIKYYDQKCLEENLVSEIDLDYESKKGKEIDVELDLNIKYY